MDYIFNPQESMQEFLAKKAESRKTPLSCGKQEIGFIKGKSAIAITRKFRGKVQNFTGESFWARGYAASTVGFDEDDVRKYIRDQDPSDGGEGAF